MQKNNKIKSLCFFLFESPLTDPLHNKKFGYMRYFLLAYNFNTCMRKFKSLLIWVLYYLSKEAFS